jgi:hypothetical protein
VIRRWDFAQEGGPARLHDELAGAGAAWLRAPELVEEAERNPWDVAAALFGERPELLERQPIRPVAGGRSFASGSMAAPFHSDSQMFLGVPPHVQVMACRQAATAAGESLYLDTWTLLDRIEAEDPALLAQLFEVERRFPFVFGDVSGPTLSRRGSSLVFTHTAFPEAGDVVAARLRPFVETAAVLELKAEAGDVLVIHNHRMLHGRRAFEDPGRAFVRLLVWRRAAYPAPARWLERARAGEAGGPDPEARRRLRAVLELLRGVPPGLLASREGVAEPELYRWRDAVLRAALEALGSGDSRRA